MLKYIIYGLIDPTTNMLRYIGLSSTGLNRPKHHLNPSTYNKRKAYIYSWIKSCVERGVCPEIVVIEECQSINELKSLEQFYISYFQSIGCPLTNLSKGGEGRLGCKQTLEEIEKRRLANTGKKRSPEFCERLRQANLGKQHSEETKRKMSLAKKGQPSPRKGIILSEEQKKKMSLAKIEKYNGSNNPNYGKKQPPHVIAAVVKAASKPIIDQNGIKYLSISDASRKLNIFPQNISAVLHGKIKSAFGYTFTFMR